MKIKINNSNKEIGTTFKSKPKFQDLNLDSRFDKKNKSYYYNKQFKKYIELSTFQGKLNKQSKDLLKEILK